MSDRAGATVVEAPGSPLLYVSHPEAVAAAMNQAAQSLACSPVSQDSPSTE